MQSAELPIIQAEPAISPAIPLALRDAVWREAIHGLCQPSGEQKTLSPWLSMMSAALNSLSRLPSCRSITSRVLSARSFNKNAELLPVHLVVGVTIAELGAGSASKTGVLLKGFTEYQADEVLYQPIDISPSALEEAAASLREAIPALRIESQVANYITEPYAIRRPEGHIVLALYIGSSIGNFSPEEARSILRNLRNHLREGDALLLGVDLAPSERKPVSSLLAAYDDARGVTAAFNKNVLTRLNRELGADFDLDCFAHCARWNAAESRVEMHLESLVTQTAHIDGERIEFARGETIHTENSYKFTDESLAALLADSGFAVDLRLHDRDRLFAVTLARAV